jgi:uncharacterized glyoxalase superfamily protein PhnB
MPKSPPDGMPTVTPYLYYDDVAAAIDWLGKAFGMRKRMAMPGPGGAILHAEIEIGRDGLVMLGPPSAEHSGKSPRDLPALNQHLYVYVQDVEAHSARARAAGAKILNEPTEMFWGDKIYAALDCEGHRWTFAQQVREVKLEDLKPPGAV